MPEPYLNYMNTSSLLYMQRFDYNDSQASIWRPDIVLDYFTVGDIGYPNASTIPQPPSLNAWMVGIGQDDPLNPLLMSAIRHDIIFDYSTSYTDNGFTIAQPIAPNNYRAIGVIAFKPAIMPLLTYRCVRIDMLQQVPPDSLIKVFDNKSANMDEKFSLWKLPYSSCLVASKTYDPPVISLYDIKNPNP